MANLGHPFWEFLVAIALFGSGCSQRVEVDLPYLNSQVESVAEAAIDNPEVRAAIDRLLTSATATPELSESAQSFAALLAEDPKLQSALQTMIAGLGDTPAVKKLVQTLLVENPQSTPEQIGEMVEKRIAAIVDGPAFDNALEQSINHIFELPNIKTLVTILNDKLAKNAQIGQLSTATLTPKLEGEVSAKLIALNGGTIPDRRRAAELMLQTYYSPERLSRWYVKFFSLPAVKQGVAIGAAQMLDLPSFRRITIELVRTVAGDATFLKRAVEGLAALMTAETPDKQTIESALGALELAVVGDALGVWMKALMADPELGAIAAKTIRAIAVSPEVYALFSELHR